MHIEQTKTGKVKSLMFGNLNLLGRNTSYVEVNNPAIVNQLLKNAPLKLVDKKRTSYQITEMTGNDYFALESL